MVGTKLGVRPPAPHNPEGGSHLKASTQEGVKDQSKVVLGHRESLKEEGGQQDGSVGRDTCSQA